MVTGGEDGPYRAMATGRARVPRPPAGEPDLQIPSDTPSQARILTVVTVTVVAGLISVYLLGQTLGSADRAKQEPTRLASAGPVTPSGPTTAPPTTAPAATGTPPAAEPGTEPARPPLPPEPGGGPYGTRQTTGTRTVALTFDDGPDPHQTPQALAVLRRYRVKATFCLVGENVRRYPELVRAIAADGHTLCNHSWSHDFRLGSRSRVNILGDLVRTNEAIRDAVPGARIGYFRQPGGYWTSRVVAAARQLGMTSLHWAVDPRDWRQPGPESITTTVTRRTFAGAIVLLHDAGGDRQDTISALTPILSDLTRRFRLDALPTGAVVPPDSDTAPSPGPIPS